MPQGTDFVRQLPEAAKKAADTSSFGTDSALNGASDSRCIHESRVGSPAIRKGHPSDRGRDNVSHQNCGTLCLRDARVRGAELQAGTPLYARTGTGMRQARHGRDFARAELPVSDHSPPHALITTGLPADAPPISRQSSSTQSCQPAPVAPERASTSFSCGGIAGR